MGRCPNNKAGGRQKKYSHKQARRTKFLKKGEDVVFDQVQAQALADAAAAAAGLASGAAMAGGSKSAQAAGAAVDEDLPGMGQWYCLFCDRHFSSAAIREEHSKTKQHRKRVRMMKEGIRPHCQLDAELAAGMGLPDNGQKRSDSAASPMVS